jgi:hypothetical protein
MARALGAVHHVQAARAEAAALEQRFDASGEARVFELGEAVEQRRNEGRKEQQHEQIERHPGEPYV